MSSWGLVVQVDSEICPRLSSSNCRSTWSAKIISDTMWSKIVPWYGYQCSFQTATILGFKAQCFYIIQIGGEKILSCTKKQKSSSLQSSANCFGSIHERLWITISPRIHSQFFMLLFTRWGMIGNLKWLLIWNYWQRRGRFDLLKHCLWRLYKPLNLTKHLSERWTSAS